VTKKHTKKWSKNDPKSDQKSDQKVTKKWKKRKKCRKSGFWIDFVEFPDVFQKSSMAKVCKKMTKSARKKTCRVINKSENPADGTRRKFDTFRTPTNKEYGDRGPTSQEKGISFFLALDFSGVKL